MAVLFNIEDEAELVSKSFEIMQTALPLPNGVPIEIQAGIGHNWLAAH